MYDIFNWKMPPYDVTSVENVWIFHVKAWRFNIFVINSSKERTFGMQFLSIIDCIKFPLNLDQILNILEDATRIPIFYFLYSNIYLLRESVFIGVQNVWELREKWKKKTLGKARILRESVLRGIFLSILVIFNIIFFLIYFSGSSKEYVMKNLQCYNVPVDTLLKYYDVW